MIQESRERKQRFSFRKLSVGLVSALLGTYFMATSPLLEGVAVQANTTEQVASVCHLVDYQYRLEAELSDAERAMIVEALPGLAQENDGTYYLVYRPKPVPVSAKQLPKSGDNTVVTGLLTGVGVGLVLLALKRRSDGKSYISALIVVTTMGASVLTYDAFAEKSSALSSFNQSLSVCVGEQLPTPAAIDGFEYVGYMRKEKSERPHSHKLDAAVPASKPSPLLEDSVVFKKQSEISPLPSEAPAVSKEQMVAKLSPDAPVAEAKPIAKMVKTTETEKQVVPFDIQYIEDTSLAYGIEEVRQPGVAGSVVRTYDVTTVDGVEVSRQGVGSPETTVPVPQIVARGVLRETVPSTAPVAEELPVATLLETEVSETRVLNYDRATQEDPNLPQGQTRVGQVGKAGQEVITYAVTTVDGAEVSRREIARERIEPVAEIVYVGTFVAEVKPVDGELPIVGLSETRFSETRILGYDTVTLEDPGLPLGQTRVGQVGKPGQEIITYGLVIVDGAEVSRREIARERIEPVSEIIYVGTFVAEVKPVVTTETITETQAIPYRTEYRVNNDLPLGEEKEVQPGHDGVQTITYQVTKENGVETKREKVGEVVTTEAQPRIVERGTKVAPKSVVTSDIVEEILPFKTRHVNDDSLLQGTEVVEQEGRNGLVRKTYTVTTLDGKEIERVLSNTERTEPVDKVVRVGTKQPNTTRVREEREVLEFRVVEHPDANLLEGTRETDVEGQNGYVVYTITEEVAPDGTVLSSTRVERDRVSAVDKVVRVGTKQPKTVLDWTAVDSLVTEAEMLRLSTRYSNDTATDKANYDATLDRAQEAKLTYLAAETTDLTQEQVNDMALAIETSRAQLDGQKTKPTLAIVRVDEDDLGRQAAVTYQLTDVDGAYHSAKVQLFDGTTLVKEVNIEDVSKPLALTGLNYFKPYTVKTVLTYDLGEGQVSETLADQRQVELEFKKIEFKDIDEVGLYRYTDGRLIRHSALTGVPTDLANYVVKINSDRHKEVLLPVSAITPTEVEGKKAYKVKVSFEELVQDTGTVYDQAYEKDYVLTLDHLDTSSSVYTSFKSLIDAIKINPAGEFRLGADLSAAEVSVTDDDKAYVPVTFTGKLYGDYNGKHFAIHELKQPLFIELSNATVQKLDLKEVAINTSQSIVGALAKVATGSTISDVAVAGTVTATREVAGLVGTAEQTTLTDVRFEGALKATNTDHNGGSTGGIVAVLKGNKAKISRASAHVNILVEGGSKNYKVGAIAGWLREPASVDTAYAQGDIVGRKSGQIGGMLGSIWPSGRASNLVSEVRVVNGNTIYGDTAHQRAAIKNAFVLTEGLVGIKDQWSTGISSAETKEKVAGMNLTASLSDSGLSLVNNTYSVDYSRVTASQNGREIAYANTELLLPFYNKEYIVHMGNKIDPTNKLYTTRLLDVVPMIGDSIVTDLAANKTKINRLMLHYADNTVAYLDIVFKKDFRNTRVADYSISGTDLLYTPEVFLSNYDAILSRVLPALSGVAYGSQTIRDVLKVPTDNPETKHLAYLYLAESFDEVQKNLPSQLRSLLSMDKAINTEGQVVEQDLIKKITDNKEALLLGLSYLNRWYNIDFGKVNTKQLTAFKLDFFGNTDKSVLDNVIALGKSGYDNLVAKNNDKAYDISLANTTGVNGLFNYLEKFRHLFLPNKTNNEWLKESSKAYIVESESLVDEVRQKQRDAYGHKNNKYSIGVYDKITSDNWIWKNMLLPLLTMKDESVYVISNLATLSFGGYERYLYDAGSTDNFVAYMRNKINQAATWQRDHQDFWYKMLSAESKDKLFRSVLNYDGFNYRNSANEATWRTLLDADKSIQQFFGPVSKFYKPNGSGAYADGSQTHFVVDRMLDRYGTSVYTHEMVHNSDGGIYFENLGRREGQGAELYALGLLQNPSSLEMHAITINTMLTGDPNDEKRVHTANPVERFKTVSDLNDYVHGMYDAVYLLDYLEAQSLIKQDTAFKKAWLRRIENYYVTDQKTGKETHAGNQLARLTDDEANALTSLAALIDGNILTRRSYGDTPKYGRNGYYTINMFSPNYAALDNPNGSPGDVMFRRMAYELFAAKGYHEGFLPYVSNKFGKEAFDANSRTWSGWFGRNVGLVTDEIVFKNIFGDKYKSWAEFKKAMYQERIDKLPNLKPITITYKLGHPKSEEKVTISNYQELQALMDRAMEEDARQVAKALASNNEKHLEAVLQAQNSWVYKLKQKIYNAYIRDTDDFRKSIFN